MAPSLSDVESSTSGVWLGRWMVLAVSLLVQSVGGLFYAFGLYSDQLKSNFNLTQEQIDYVGTAANVGGNFGAHLGFLFDAYGPIPVLVIALVTGLGGWIPIWYALSKPWDAPYALLLFFAFLQGHAQMAGDLASVPAVGGNFPKHRGLAIGAVKSFVGLSGALATQYYAGIFKSEHYKCQTDSACLHNSTSNCKDSCTYWDHQEIEPICNKCQGFIPFLLFIAGMVTVIYIAGILFIKRIPIELEDTKQRSRATKYLGRLTTIIAMLALMCGISSVLQEFATESLGRYGKLIAMCVVQGAFLLMLAYVGTRTDGSKGSKDQSEESKGLLSGAINEDYTKPETPLEVKMFTVKETLCTVQYWCLCTAFFVGTGSGMMIINNIAQIIDADAHHMGNDKTVFITIISVCNCWGRLLSGWFGDILIVRNIPRPVVFAISLGLMAAAQVLIMIGSTGLLYVACILAGLSYGAFNALQPTLIVEMFGQKNFASIYSINAIAGALASIGIASQMAGALYDKRAHKTPNGKLECFGSKCFLSTALICAIGCCLSIILALIMASRTKKRYQTMYDDIRKKK